MIVASGSEDGIIRLSDVVTGAHIKPRWPMASSPPHSIVFSEDDKMVVIGFYNGTVELRDTKSVHSSRFHQHLKHH
jgi:WD40 repeat protein